MAFIRTADLREFEGAEDPRVLIGEHWLHFQAHPELFGIVFWGVPNAEQTGALVASLQLELGEGVAPHRSLVDASRLQSADLGAFEVLNTYVVDHQEQLSRAVTRLALVRPSGMAGAVTSGFYEVLDSPYPVALFDEIGEALVWLEEEASLGPELDELVGEVVGRPVVLAQLWALLVKDLREATPARAARALGMSERTLQRRLQKEGTTFAAELASARLGEARRRMVESDLPLATIALDAGFSSQQHFSSTFREAEGEPPSAWRKRQR